MSVSGAAGAGALSDWLVLSHIAPPVPDGALGYDTPATVYAQEFCEVQSATASWVERVVGVQVQAPAMRLVKIYARPDVRVTDLGVWTDRLGVTHTLTVKGLQLDPGGEYLWLACEERLPGQ